MSTKLLMDDYCFACGSKNPGGLQLRISESSDGVEAVINPPAWSQGYVKTVHGGIISTILDEMAVWAAFKKGYRCVTAELNVRMRKPMKVDEEYTARGRIVKTKHNLVQAESEIINNHNKLIASARVKLLKME